MNKKFCHLLVGFSITDYFKNLITSVLELDDNSDVIIITTGNPRLFGWGGKFDYEFNESNKIKSFVNKVKNKYNRNNIYFYELKCNSVKDKKVGYLYDAYNLALKTALEKQCDYLNIIQNDCQLMLWSENIKEMLDEIFTIEKKVFFISSGFLRKAVNYNFKKNFSSKEILFDSLNFKKKVYSNQKSALGDWGIFDLNKIKKINFKFIKNENYLSKYYLDMGYKSILSPIPFVSVLPWPATVRNDRIKGFALQFKGKTFLKISDKLNEKILFNNEPMWEENCVETQEWWSLEPNWATDLNLDYFKSIFLYFINFKKDSKIFFSNGLKKKKLYPPSLITRYRPSLLLTLLSFPFNIFLKIIFKIKNYLNK